MSAVWKLWSSNVHKRCKDECKLWAEGEINQHVAGWWETACCWNQKKLYHLGTNLKWHIIWCGGEENTSSVTNMVEVREPVIWPFQSLSVDLQHQPPGRCRASSVGLFSNVEDPPSAEAVLHFPPCSSGNNRSYTYTYRLVFMELFYLFPVSM